MEVFGMLDTSLSCAKELRRRITTEEYGAYGWWHWDATEKTESGISSFPEAKNTIHPNHNLKMGLKWRTYFRW